MSRSTVRTALLPIAILLAWLVAAVAALPAGAITYGEPDAKRHPNVGTMVLQTDDGFFKRCSGTLIADKVFLTAAHCEPPEAFRGAKLYVTFDDVVNLKSPTLIAANSQGFQGNEDFTRLKGQADSDDIAVIELARPASDVYPGIEPAVLPPAGLLTDLKRAGALQDLVFTNVGYGAFERELGGGSPTFPRTVQRHMSTSSFNALNEAWLRLSQNPATGNGGTCYGDSGGPQFIKWGDETIQVSITTTGDMQCQATNVTYRLDAEAARTFLSQYPSVDLP